MIFVQTPKVSFLKNLDTLFCPTVEAFECESNLIFQSYMSLCTSFVDSVALYTLAQTLLVIIFLKSRLWSDDSAINAI